MDKISEKEKNERRHLLKAAGVSFASLIAMGIIPGRVLANANDNEKFEELERLLEDRKVDVDALRAVLSGTTTHFVIATDMDDIKGDGSNDDTAGIQALLNLADSNEGVTIYFPAGTYKLTNILLIKHGTKLVANPNAIFSKEHNSGLLKNISPDSNATGYNGNGNITIMGGVWDNHAPTYTGGTSFIFAHAENLIFKDLTILDIDPGHAMEINSSKDVLIENCKFKGMKQVSQYSEAIQIDLMKSSATFPWKSGNFDNTTCTNITVRNCYFGPSKNLGSWATGVGSHGGTIGVQHKNITIADNIFEETIRYGVRAYSWKRFNVSDNHFINCGAPIMIETNAIGGENSKDVNGQQTNASQPCDSIMFANNIIVGGGAYYSSITVRGKAENGEISNVSIIGNSFKKEDDTASKATIQVHTNVKDVTISDNVISDVKQNALYIHSGVWFVTLGNNSTQNIGSTGMYLKEVHTLSCTGNIIQNTGYDGLWIQETNNVSITGNVVEGVADSRYHYRLSGGNDRFVLGSNTAADTSKRASSALYVGSTNTNGIITGNNFSDIGISINSSSNIQEANNLT